MQHYQRHRAFYDQPIYLTEEETADPVSVIHSFFGAYHLHEIRQLLAECVETALTSENAFYGEAGPRDGLVCFHRQLEYMIEAASLIR